MTSKRAVLVHATKSEEQLINSFSTCGQIVKCYPWRSKNGNKKHFFIVFADEGGVVRALASGRKLADQVHRVVRNKSLEQNFYKSLEVLKEPQKQNADQGGNEGATSLVKSKPTAPISTETSQVGSSRDQASSVPDNMDVDRNVMDETHQSPPGRSRSPYRSSPRDNSYRPSINYSPRAISYRRPRSPMADHYFPPPDRGYGRRDSRDYNYAESSTSHRSRKRYEAGRCCSRSRSPSRIRTPLSPKSSYHTDCINHSNLATSSSATSRIRRDSSSATIQQLPPLRIPKDFMSMKGTLLPPDNIGAFARRSISPVAERHQRPRSPTPRSSISVEKELPQERKALTSHTPTTSSSSAFTVEKKTDLIIYSYNTTVSLDLSKLDDDPEVPIGILRLSNAGPEHWMMVSAQYRHDERFKEALLVVDAMIEELGSKGIPQSDLKPALLLRAQCHFDIAKQQKKFEKLSESDEKRAFFSFVNSLIRMYGTMKFPQLEEPPTNSNSKDPDQDGKSTSSDKENANHLTSSSVTNIPLSFNLRDPPTSPIAVRLRTLQEDYTRLRSVHASTLNDLREAQEALKKKDTHLDKVTQVLATTQHEMAGEVGRREYLEKRLREELRLRKKLKKYIRENTMREVFEHLSETFGKASKSQDVMVELIGMEEPRENLDESDSEYFEL